jgi:DNA-binding CsgD family transcriptional regulator
MLAHATGRPHPAFVKSLSLAQVRRLNDALLHLYGEIARGDFESAAIGMIQRLIPGESHMTGVLNTHTGRMTGRVVPELENMQEVTASFSRWGHQHPALGRRAQAQSISEHLSRAEWHRLDLFAEVFRPLAVEDDLTLEIGLSDRVSLMIGTTRTRRTFKPEERILLTLASPHLRAAWHQSEAATRLPWLAAVTGDPRPNTLELAASGRVLACGPGSAALLQAYFDADVAAAALPGELRDWVRRQQRSTLREPFRVHGPNGLLTIHYLRDSVVGRHFLVLAEERAISRGEGVAQLDGLGLSRREQEVLFWVAQGKTNATVARVLGISPGTVKRHLENIYARLGVENRHGATLWALQCLQDGHSRSDSAK